MMKHIISFTSALWVIINLLIGFAILLPVSIISWLLPLPIISRACAYIVDHVYRTAVRIDSFWMQQVVGIELVINGERSTDPTPVVICNHQSWFDIPLVQEVISGKGPIVKFLIKREIVWVPIIGWICLALNFPRLRRNKNSQSGDSDFSIVKKVSKTHGHESGALLIFPEGTRFTELKKQKQKAPYEHLVNPRAGGLKIIKQHANPDTQLVDITINYHQKNVRIWDCLHGNPKKITITLEHFNLSEIEDVEGWLNERWLVKDGVLGEGIS